jgi:excisionase family DNA binding protein
MAPSPGERRAPGAERRRTRPRDEEGEMSDGRQGAFMPRTSSHGVASHEQHDQLLTVAQAGDYLGTGERFIRRLIAERRITYVKIGKYVRLQRSILDDFIEAGRVTSGG